MEISNEIVSLCLYSWRMFVLKGQVGTSLHRSIWTWIKEFMIYLNHIFSLEIKHEVNHQHKHIVYVVFSNDLHSLYQHLLKRLAWVKGHIFRAPQRPACLLDRLCLGKKKATLYVDLTHCTVIWNHLAQEVIWPVSLVYVLAHRYIKHCTVMMFG